MSVTQHLTPAVPRSSPCLPWRVGQALQWLTRRGASRLYLCGDSSGGTMVLEVMLWVAHHRLSGHSLNVTIDGGATFSAWIDLTASGESYDSQRFCDGFCWGMGDPVRGPCVFRVCAQGCLAGILPTRRVFSSRK
jgi:hypothetical protein